MTFLQDFERFVFGVEEEDMDVEEGEGIVMLEGLMQALEEMDAEG